MPSPLSSPGSFSSISGLLPSAWRKGLSWLFRPQCAACGDPLSSGLPFCAACSPSLEENLAPCTSCAEPSMRGHSETCARCKERPLPLHKIVAPWQYGGALAEALVRMKFQGRSEIARTLAPLIAPVLVATAVVADATFIAPIPLHWTRRLHRGFDQTQLLLRHAESVAKPPVPVASLLKRVRATEYQSRTGDVRGRQQNLAGALRVAPRWKDRLDGASVILFDDVVTTGATMAAAARALRRAGAKRVVGVALARAGSR